MRNRWRSFFLLFSLAAILLSPGTVAAQECRCSAENPTPDALFVGTVIGIDSPLIYGLIGAVVNNLRGIDYAQGVIFSVQDAWTGVAREEITIRTGGVGRCNVAFERGRQYLVRASHGPDGYLRADACGATMPVEAVSAEISALNTTETLTLKPVPRVTLFEAAMFSIIALLIYWWIFMLRAIRANPLRF